MQGAATPLIVLDDDPTGAQALAGIRVLLSWDEARIGVALDRRPAVHLITNSRAVPPARAAALVRSAAESAVAAAPGARIVLRGDSTLRGHLLEEVLALREVVLPGVAPVLLLVPALPAAGRVTLGGVQLLERDGRHVPLHETEYALDGIFAYRSARLLDWAEERSGGFFHATAGRELPLAALRRDGGSAVAGALTDLAAAGEPAVLAPDAETLSDLEAIARGYADALAARLPVLVRCAPAFAGVLSGATAPEPVPAPHAEDGLLLVCGSYVPASRRQLDRLLAAYAHALVEVDPAALASERRGAEVARAARAVDERLSAGPLAVVATPAERPACLRGLDAGESIASGLAAVIASLATLPRVVVAKGGVTSAVTLRDGIGADEADVVGPVLPGVSLWRATDRDGRRLDYIVVPGNVGGDELLADLVARMLGR